MAEKAVSETDDQVFDRLSKTVISPKYILENQAEFTGQELRVARKAFVDEGIVYDTLHGYTQNLVRMLGVCQDPDNNV